MVHNLSLTNSVVNQFLFELRHKDIQNDRSKFRTNLKRLGWILAYELSKELGYEDRKFQTPLAEMTIPLVHTQPVILAILRAAVPFLDGFLDVFDQADTGFIGAYRRKDVKPVDINLDYLAIPGTVGKPVILVDPMLATGKSVAKVIDRLMDEGEPAHIHLVCAVAAPEGIDYISNHLENDRFTIWAGAVDQFLDDRSYIVPGLGDAGDLCFGPKN